MGNIFFDLLEVNIAISFLILALYLLAGKLRKRYGAGWMKAVWLLLAVRLLIPYNFSLPFTEIRFLDVPGFEQENSSYRNGFLFGNTGENAGNLVRGSVQDLNVKQDGNGVQARDSMQEINANGEKYHFAGNSGTGDVKTLNTDDIESEGEGNGQGEWVSKDETEGISGKNDFFYSELSVMIWILGMCLCCVYLFFCYLLFLRKYRRNLYPIADKDLEKRINGIQKKLTGSVSIPVFQSRDIASPMLTGMIRPKLILPVLKKKWTKTELELMMAHELCHYKKKDLFWKLFMSAAWCVNWFNPMVTLLKKQFFYDLELACDGAVLSECDGEEREIYARMMLSFAGNRNGMPAFSTGFWEDRKRMRKRIDYMFYGKEKKKGIFGIVVAGVLILSASLLVSCGYKTKEKEEPDGTGIENGSQTKESVTGNPDINPETADNPGAALETVEAKQVAFDYNHEYNEMIRCYEGDVYLAKEDGIYRIPGGDGEEELLYGNYYGRLRRGMELYQDFLYFCGSVSVGDEQRSTIYRMSLNTFEVQDALENFERKYKELYHISIYEDKMYIAGGWGQRIGFELDQNGEVTGQLDDRAEDFLYREYNDYIDLEEQAWDVELYSEEYWEIVEKEKERYQAVMDVAACKKMLQGNQVVSRYKNEALTGIFLETEDGEYEHLCDTADRYVIVTETGVYYFAEAMGDVWYVDFDTKTPRLFYEKDQTLSGEISLATYDADYVYLTARYFKTDEEDGNKFEHELIRVPRNGGEEEVVYRFNQEWDIFGMYGLYGNCGVYDGRMFFYGHDAIDIANASTDVILKAAKVEEGQWEMAKQVPDFAVSVDYEEGEERMILSEFSDQTVLNEIPVTKDQGMVFINMINENSGYLLYCGSPAAGLMNKTLYVTKDRWKTYSETDISSKIDGYPNSLSAVSEDKIYIGTQMRSNGYLFVTKDQGESFEAVWAEDDRYFRYGYAPLFDQENRRAYLILEAENEYFVYQAEYPAADGGDSWNLTWESAGKFILEDYGTIEEYFLYEGHIYLVNWQGKRCQIALE